MSFVGPRPEVRPYVELFREDYEEILQVVPGITEPGFLGDWMLGAPLALEGAVADKIEQAILGWRKGSQGLLGEPP
jgi:hypothetical protein